jgi:hypothetical protein
MLSGEDVYMACKMQQQMEEAHGFDFARSFVSAIITRNGVKNNMRMYAYVCTHLHIPLFRVGLTRNSEEQYAYVCMQKRYTYMNTYTHICITCTYACKIFVNSCTARTW